MKPKSLLFTFLIVLGNVSALESSTAAAGFTPHFLNWLKSNSYSEWDFDRSDLVNSTFGGKDSDQDEPQNIPIIFFHGNSDIGMGGTTSTQTGFRASIEYFLSKGYKPSELYVTTWGNGNILEASTRYHSKKYITYLRAFMEAVLKYTGKGKVNIVAHSMGVTLARKVVKGGLANDLLDGGSYNVGPSLKDNVNFFLGIAGANWGLTDCYPTPEIPTCNPENGFFPGVMAGPIGLSKYLYDLNYSGGSEGQKVFTFWGVFDDLIEYGDLVWGQYTSRIPSQTGERQFNELKYTHIHLKDYTVDQQFEVIQNEGMISDA